MAVKPIPDGYGTVTPGLNVKDCDKMIDFLVRAFGAEVRFKMQDPGGPVMHAEVQIGTSVLMMGEAMMDAPTTSSFMLYVADCDAACKRAEDAGATVTRPPTNEFWGDRFARLKDDWGNRWAIATHVEDVTPEEIDRRAKEFMATQKPPA